MFSKNYHPSKAQKDWLRDLAQMGSIISYRRPCEVHHCCGRMARHDKVLIGPWFCIPLTTDEHRSVPSWGQFRKQREKALFRLTCGKYLRLYGPLPFGDDVMEAILNYSKGVTR